MGGKKAPTIVGREGVSLLVVVVDEIQNRERENKIVEHCDSFITTPSSCCVVQAGT